MEPTQHGQWAEHSLCSTNASHIPEQPYPIFNTWSFQPPTTVSVGTQTEPQSTPSDDADQINPNERICDASMDTPSSNTVSGSALPLESEAVDPSTDISISSENYLWLKDLIAFQNSAEESFLNLNEDGELPRGTEQREDIPGAGQDLIIDLDIPQPRKRCPYLKMNLIVRRRRQIKPVEVGNNNFGRAGNLRCQACRNRRSKVLRPILID